MWHITWDPTEETATRPLAIRKDGTWYCYGWDLTKNICEVFKSDGYIGTAYTYTPYGVVTPSGTVTQPIQWSSEYADTETSLTYYNYRHYNPYVGRWVSRDLLEEAPSNNLYSFTKNNIFIIDNKGLSTDRYIFCTLLEEKPEGWGDKKYVKTIPSLTLLGFPITVREVYYAVISKMFCKFRCWKSGRDNCYTIPCRSNCPKDHGTEVTVRMRSTHRNTATAFCRDVEPEVRSGKIDGGALITKDYKR